MRNLAHLTARFFGAPLLIEPSAGANLANAFMAVLGGEQPTQIVMVNAHGAAGQDATMPEPGAYATSVRPGAKFEGKPYTVTEAGVGVLPVLGPLVQRAGLINPDCTPVTSYQRINQRLEQMLQDPDVKAILMEFDSPGGEAAGMFELAGTIQQARATKPIWGHVNESAYSAGYGLAAAVDQLYVPQGGSVGSIGVRMMHLDQSAADAKKGYVYTNIYAGARKVDFDSHSPLSAEAQATAQAAVNRLYDQFTTQVSTARGVDLAVVRGTEAGILAAADAKAMGFVSGIASFQDTLASLTAHITQPARTTSLGGGYQSSPTTGGRQAASTPKGNATMADSLPVADQAATTAARAEGHAAGLAEGAAQGATAERARIGAILQSEPAGTRVKLANHLAFNTSMAAEDAVVVLAAAGQDQAAASTTATTAAASPLATAMAGLQNPNVGADGGNAQTAAPEDTPQALAKNVVSLLAATRGAKA